MKTTIALILAAALAGFALAQTVAPLAPLSGTQRADIVATFREVANRERAYAANATLSGYPSAANAFTARAGAYDAAATFLENYGAPPAISKAVIRLRTQR